MSFVEKEDRIFPRFECWVTEQMEDQKEGNRKKGDKFINFRTEIRILQDSLWYTVILKDQYIVLAEHPRFLDVMISSTQRFIQFCLTQQFSEETLGAGDIPPTPDKNQESEYKRLKNRYQL